MERKPIYWGLPNQERLHAESLDEVVEEFLYDWGEPDEDDEIEVSGFALVEVCMPSPENVVGEILERLDEDWGDPDGDSTNGPTPEMIEAAKQFLAVIKENYTPWACEEVCRQTVKLKEWVDRKKIEESPVP